MSLQTYLDNAHAKIGKTPDEFRILAQKQGLTKHGEIVAWLKRDFGLGHGHATAVTKVVLHGHEPKLSVEEKIGKHFSGRKAIWRDAYDELIRAVTALGADVAVSPTERSYLSLVRGSRKFAVVQVAAERLDVGLKLPNVAPAGRLEESNAWSGMDPPRAYRLSRRDRPGATDLVMSRIRERRGLKRPLPLDG